jgi:serine/threonine protein phosphatase Stp1
MHRPSDSAATHQGGRPYNEDAYFSCADLGLWAVADGAGGHADGAIASAAVVEALAAIPGGLSGAELLAQLRVRLESAHMQLLAREGDTIIASTVVVLVIRGDHFACLWAGDSRAYLLRHGVLRQITEDHSLVQQLVDEGVIDTEEAERHPQRNVITRAIGGGGKALELQKVSGRVLAGDVFLLCSDGVSKLLADADLATQLGAGAGAEDLVRTVLARGASDNVTAVVVGV